MRLMKKKTVQGHGATLSIIPIALLIVCVIGSIALVASRAVRSQQDYELAREKKQLAQSFGFEAETLLSGIARDEILADLYPAQKNRETLEQLLGALSRQQGLDYAAVINKSDGSMLAEIGEAGILPQRGKAIRAFIDGSRMRGVDAMTLGIGREARNVQDGKTILSLAALPFGKNLVLLATRPLGPAGLQRLSTMLAIPNLRAITGLPDRESSHGIASLDGESEISVVWDPSRAASEIFGDLALFGLLGSLVVTVVGVILLQRIRHSTAEILRREAKASHEAKHDSLSGLPNRAVFCEVLTENLHDLPQKGGVIAVLLLDLDKFKDVNDTFGHAAGDKLIVEFGQRVRAFLRQTDLIARLGGDEFAVLQTSIRSHADAARLAQSIIDAANLPFMMEGAAMRIGVTIGIAMVPENGNDVATLLRSADTALYRAKNEGRNRFAIYEHRMTESERIRKLVDDELRGAIERDEFTLLYQPQVYAETGKVASVEALVRWHHPKHGVISPATFISAAEERGLIVPLGEWVMRRACRDAARWPGLRVGVNVSAIQFRQGDFVKSVERVMADAAIEPGRLELELTEGVLVDDADQAEDAMMELRSLGVKLALDDFGTGYSSLIYLRRFAFDKIKIDKSFLDSMEATGESAILVHSVVHLGRALGLEVTAEGVETEEQRRFLHAVGCHYLQGYLFSQPVPAETIDTLLTLDQDLSVNEAARLRKVS